MAGGERQLLACHVKGRLGCLKQALRCELRANGTAVLGQRTGFRGARHGAGDRMEKKQSSKSVGFDAISA